MEKKKKFKKYDKRQYFEDIKRQGLKKTWTEICDFCLSYSRKIATFYDPISLEVLPNLYEAGLAYEDKLLKKNSGQYYTPDDVAEVMAKWLLKCDGETIADVGCGTGKLILAYLDLIDYEKAQQLIKDGKIYLYESDETALNICKTILMCKYGDIAENVKYINSDFLNCNIKLPENCKVISNPPYAKFSEPHPSWEKTVILKKTKELFAAFMEKIIMQSKSSVIITPFVFMSGNKFFSLRKKMTENSNGFIISFDNVPGNIFHGKKHGTFNSNKSNSVRAAITVSLNEPNKRGYVVSPFIRFGSNERSRILDTDVLEKTLPTTRQVINNKNKRFKKIDKNLEELYNIWVSKSKYKLRDLITKKETEFLLDIPDTCRYFTTASSRELDRRGSFRFFFDNEEHYKFIYCFINSSFAYWWWRIFDGGIVYPKSLLLDLPIPINLLTSKDKDFFNKMFNKMKFLERTFIRYKNNAGRKQENIKFPEKYREEINQQLLSMLGSNVYFDIFNKIHSNKFFDVEEDMDMI